jgi:hypothetical protein
MTNPPPIWINGKLCCQHPDTHDTCGREMFVRGKTAVCEIPSHGGIFLVPDKRHNAPDAARKWKDSLPIARSRFRKSITTDGVRHSVGVWRVNGDPEHAWSPELFDVKEGCPVPAEWLVARFRISRKAYRTVLLRPFAISADDRQYRHWEND